MQKNFWNFKNTLIVGSLFLLASEANAIQCKSRCRPNGQSRDNPPKSIIEDPLVARVQFTSQDYKKNRINKPKAKCKCVGTGSSKSCGWDNNDVPYCKEQYNGTDNGNIEPELCEEVLRPGGGGYSVEGSDILESTRSIGEDPGVCGPSDVSVTSE